MRDQVLIANPYAGIWSILIVAMVIVLTLNNAEHIGRGYYFNAITFTQIMY